MWNFSDVVDFQQISQTLWHIDLQYMCSLYAAKFWQRIFNGKTGNMESREPTIVEQTIQKMIQIS